MTANIPGARLREVEQRLALLRGEEAVNHFLAEHPNEIKVLEQMVEQRRAGKPVPSLTRVQRAMLWSDGVLEFTTEAAPDGRGRAGERGGGDRSGTRGGAGRQGRERGATGEGSSGSGGGAPAGSTRHAPSQNRGPRAGPANGQGRAPRRGGPPSRGGSERNRGRGFGEDRGDRGMPRAGEGWLLLREGEKPPEPEPAPEYDWDEEETVGSKEVGVPVVETTGADQSRANAEPQ